MNQGSDPNGGGGGWVSDWDKTEEYVQPAGTNSYLYEGGGGDWELTWNAVSGRGLAYGGGRPPEDSGVADLGEKREGTISWKCIITGLILKRDSWVESRKHVSQCLMYVCAWLLLCYLVHVKSVLGAVGLFAGRRREAVFVGLPWLCLVLMHWGKRRNLFQCFYFICAPLRLLCFTTLYLQGWRFNFCPHLGEMQTYTNFVHMLLWQLSLWSDWKKTH